jgi:hypothetical protein
MRRYKTVARILFIVSVVHLALAAPALGRPGHQDVAEDVTGAPEERRSTDGDSGSISSEYFRPSGSSGSSSSDDDYYRRAQPGSVVSMNFGYDSEELANSPEREPVPVSDSSHDLTTPASGSTSSHLSAGLSTRNGGGGTPNAADAEENNPLLGPTTNGDDPGPLSAGSSLDSSTRNGATPNAADPEEKAPLLGPTPHSDDLEPVSPSQKHEIVPVSAPTKPHGVDQEPDAQGYKLAPGSPPPSSEDSLGSVAKAASKAAPKADEFFNKELMGKIKDYSILGTIAGVASGVISSIQKQIIGTISPGAYVSALFPPSPADIYPSHKHSDL